jgi:hypothetical protein
MLSRWGVVCDHVLILFVRFLPCMCVNSFLFRRVINTGFWVGKTVCFIICSIRCRNRRIAHCIFGISVFFRFFLLAYDRFLTRIFNFLCCFYYPVWCCVHFYVDSYGHKSEPSRCHVVGRKSEPSRFVVVGRCTYM